MYTLWHKQKIRKLNRLSESNGVSPKWTLESLKTDQMVCLRNGHFRMEIREFEDSPIFQCRVSTFQWEFSQGGSLPDNQYDNHTHSHYPFSVCYVVLWQVILCHIIHPMTNHVNRFYEQWPNLSHSSTIELFQQAVTWKRIDILSFRIVR